MKIAITFLLLGLLTVPSVQAQEKTYGGRTFDKWRRLVVNDLDPATRSKAMTAIGVFGKHGQRDAAVETLKQAIANEKHFTVIEAGYVALLTLGDAAVPTIEAGLKSDDEFRQRSALRALAECLRPGRRVALRGETTQALADKTVPLLLDVLQDAEAPNSDRLMASKTLHSLFRLNESGELAQSAVKPLMEAARSTNLELASEAIRTIGFLGEQARPAIPMLIEFVREHVPTRQSSYRSGRPINARPFAAVLALGTLGPLANEALPALEATKEQFGRSAPAAFQMAIDSINGDAEDE